jgi:Na+/H+ antiporter NhaD/arsenite permease-like protein
VDLAGGAAGQARRAGPVVALVPGACLGGNRTLTSASTNVTVTSLTEKDGQRISFIDSPPSARV